MPSALVLATLLAADPQPLMAERFALAECPRWDERISRLYWVDIPKRRIHRCAEDGSDHRSWEVEDQAGCLALTSDPEVLLIGTGRAVGLLHLGTGVWRRMHHLGDADPVRINDGAVDPLARFWFGTTRLDYGFRGGKLYRLDPDGSCRVMVEPVSISNGLAWTGDALFYADSTTRRLDRFAWSTEGMLGERSEAWSTKAVNGLPDGICADSEGRIWVAVFSASLVARYDPVSRKQIEGIALPVSLVTACCIGGSRMDTLFITSAQDHGNLPRSQDPSLGGAVFHLPLGRPLGVPNHRFPVSEPTP
jgi:sugar lactone lactonase YvrE